MIAASSGVRTVDFAGAVLASKMALFKNLWVCTYFNRETPQPVGRLVDVPLFRRTGNLIHPSFEEIRPTLDFETR